MKKSERKVRQTTRKPKKEKEKKKKKVVENKEPEKGDFLTGPVKKKKK